MRRIIYMTAVALAVLAAGSGSVSAAGEPTPSLPPPMLLLDDHCDLIQIASDSRHAVCIADGKVWSMPLTSEAPAVQLDPDLPAAGEVAQWFGITPDGSTVVIADVADRTDWEFGHSLFAVPIEGGIPLSLTPFVGDDDLLWSPDITPDGERVVFFYWNDTDGGLYSVKLDGTGLITVDVPGAEILTPPSLWISPDSNWVQFFDGGRDLAYIAPLAGGSTRVLSGDNQAAGRIVDGWFTSDSTRWVYVADFDTLNVDELYSAPTAGGDAVKLNRTLTPGEYIYGTPLLLPDASGVVYAVHDPAASEYTWYVVDAAGGDSVELGSGLVAEVSSDSSTVVITPALVEAYPTAGGSPVVLGSTGSASISPDGQTVWMWQAASASTAQLHSVSILGGTSTPHPGAVITDSGWVGNHVQSQISADSKRFVYGVDTDGDDLDELWMAPRDGDGSASLISDDVTVFLVDYTTYSGFDVSPDSSTVVYVGDPLGTGNATYASRLTRFPEADNVTWHVDENAAPGTVLGSLTATDPDGDDLHWALVQPSSIFAINAETGRFEVIGSLDYEAQTSHVVNIEVSDGVVTTMATVTVQIGNVNDNPPTATDLSVSVPENTTLGTELGTLSFEDLDGDAVSFTLAEPQPLFEVTTDGRVILTAFLDYETATGHDFAVVVDDGVYTDTATVIVSVIDVDETLPTTTTTTTLAPPPEFDDVPDESVFRDDIIWLATEGITRGCNPPINDHYCPDDYVTRGQMAAFLHRALGETLTPGPGIEFIDDDTSGFESDIEWLASVGVTRGCNPPTNDRFCPDQYVTRGQMAAFLDRALDLPEPLVPNLFTDDDGSPFEDQIDRLATAGITRGCNPPGNTLFCPSSYVTRGQMAAFLHRILATD